MSIPSVEKSSPQQPPVADFCRHASGNSPSIYLPEMHLTLPTRDLAKSKPQKLKTPPMRAAFLPGAPRSRHGTGFLCVPIAARMMSASPGRLQRPLEGTARERLSARSNRSAKNILNAIRKDSVSSRRSKLRPTALCPSAAALGSASPKWSVRIGSSRQLGRAHSSLDGSQETVQPPLSDRRGLGGAANPRADQEAGSIFARRRRASRPGG